MLSSENSLAVPSHYMLLGTQNHIVLELEVPAYPTHQSTCEGKALAQSHS